MGFEGYLFKFGEFIFPLKYMVWDSFEMAPGQRQSLDAYTDLDGVARDNALEHTKTEIKFNVLPMIGKEWEWLMGNMVKNYLNFSARDANCTYFDFEQWKYRTGHFYFDKSFRVKANIPDGEIKIKETTWTFIEY